LGRHTHRAQRLDDRGADRSRRVDPNRHEHCDRYGPLGVAFTLDDHQRRLIGAAVRHQLSGLYDR
jgi:hypothetical protein